MNTNSLNTNSLNTNSLNTKYINIFNAIQDEFDDTELAMIVVQMYTLHLSLTPTVKELSGKLSFKDRVIKLFDTILWETKNDSIEKYNLAIDLWECLHEWETRQSMHGLGGCVIKTFKELLTKNQNNSCN